MRFVRYLLEKGDRYVTEDGDFEIKVLAKNWGKNNGFNNPEFRDFLELMNHFGLGRYTDEGFTKWALTADPTNLPDEPAE